MPDALGTQLTPEQQQQIRDSARSLGQGALKAGTAYTDLMKNIYVDTPNAYFNNYVKPGLDAQKDISVLAYRAAFDVPGLMREHLGASVGDYLSSDIDMGSFGTVNPMRLATSAHPGSVGLPPWMKVGLADTAADIVDIGTNPGSWFGGGAINFGAKQLAGRFPQAARIMTRSFGKAPGAAGPAQRLPEAYMRVGGTPGIGTLRGVDQVGRVVGPLLSAERLDSRLTALKPQDQKTEAEKREESLVQGQVGYDGAGGETGSEGKSKKKKNKFNFKIKLPEQKQTFTKQRQATVQYVQSQRSGGFTAPGAITAPFTGIGKGRDVLNAR